MLFETKDSKAAGESAAAGDQSREIQTIWMDFLANLLHFKHWSDAYSLDLAKWKSVPLYLKNYADNSVLNELFFYILSRALHWQGLRRLAPRTATDVEALCIAEYPQIEESRSGPELPKTAYNAVHLQDLCGLLRGLGGRRALLQDYGHQEQA